MKYFLIPVILIAITGLTGCQQTTKTIEPTPVKMVDTLTLIDTNHLDAKPSMHTPDELFALPEQSKQQFLDFYNAKSERKTLGHNRIYKYLSNRLSSFNYYSGTNTAAVAEQTNSGNCLSLAILTTAYAKLANIKISYVEMTSAPVYSQEGQFEFISGHVVSKLQDPTFIPQIGAIYIRKPSIVIDYFPNRDSWTGLSVSTDNFVAMYYRNLSADALAENKLSDAAWFVIESFRYAPNELDGINLLAVINRRMGQAKQAETLYQHGLTLTEHSGKQNLNLLSNYMVLLNQQERFTEAQKIKTLIDKADDPSPFRWLTLANEALMAKELKKAKRYFQKVTEKAHYLPYGYEGLAKVYFIQGRTRSAKEQLDKAIQRTRNKQTEQRYIAKLASLKASSSDWWRKPSQNLIK